MKRPKRKRSSKGGRPAKLPIDAERAAGPSTALAGADRQTQHSDEFIAPVEVKKPGSDPAAFAGADYVIDVGDELLATIEGEKPAGPSVALAGADRRSHPRYKFIAAVW